jgi:hypothetical protein
VGGAVLALSGSLVAFFAIAAVATSLYGLIVLWAIASGTWFAGQSRAEGAIVSSAAR